MCKLNTELKMRPHRLIHDLDRLPQFVLSSVNSINLCAHNLLLEQNVSLWWIYTQI